MKKLIYIFAILVYNYSFSQINLVPNPSFEDTIPTPLGGVITDATGWINCGNTPDYYNAGFNGYSPGFGVPSCSYTGYQNAYHGNGFAGIGLTAIPEQPAEFIGINLTQSLVIGNTYYVSAYISRADDYSCATNNFGFRFFNTLYFSPPTNPPPIDNFAHVNSSAIISDSLSWHYVIGSFIADSAYKFLVIGNFFNLSQTNTLNCTSSDASYYYVDFVCVSTSSETCMNPTGISKLASKATTSLVYPNPAKDLIHIKNTNMFNSYKIMNCIGEVSSEGVLQLGDNIINISAYPQGLYTILIDQQYHSKILILTNKNN